MAGLIRFKVIIIFWLLSSPLALLAQQTPTKILHFAITSDMHGVITTALNSNRSKHHGIAHLVRPLKKLRLQHPDLILLDGGDTIGGDPTTFYHHYASLSPEVVPIIGLMNHLRYDAMTVGNHDLEVSAKPRLQAQVQSHFPWLGANIVKVKTGEPVYPTHLILERDGLNILIIGLTTPGTPMWVDPKNYQGWEFWDIPSTLQRWLNLIRSRESIDVVVALLHAGDSWSYDHTEAAKQGLATPNSADLTADHLNGVHLIISGHAHKKSPKKRNEIKEFRRTPVISGGSHARGFYHVTLTLQRRDQQWRTTQVDWKWKSAQAKADPEALSLVQHQLSEVQGYLSEDTGWKIRHQPDHAALQRCLHVLSLASLTKQSPLPTAALWSLVSPRLQIKAGDLGKAVRRQHLFDWFRYDNRPVLAQLYKRQLEVLLQPQKLRSRGVWVALFRQLNVVMQTQSGFVFPEWNQQQEGWSGLERYSEQTRLNTWVANYHWNGGKFLLGEALVNQGQLLQRPNTFIRDEVFDYLKHNSQMPDPSCEWLEK